MARPKLPRTQSIEHEEQAIRLRHQAANANNTQTAMINLSLATFHIQLAILYELRDAKRPPEGDR